MINVGDLVYYKKNSYTNLIRSASNKTIGIVVGVERSSYWTYEGDHIDKVRVRWGALGEEVVPEVFLEKLTKDT
jgi:hypothetical protein